MTHRAGMASRQSWRLRADSPVEVRPVSRPRRAPEGQPDQDVDPAPGPADGLERTVVDQVYDGVYYVDRARRIRYWNDGAKRLTGFPASAVVGHLCYDNLLNHVDAEGRSLCRSRCPLAATMADGEPREAEVFLRHRDGHRVPIRLRATPVRDREGKVIGAVEIFDDRAELSAVRREVSELRDLAMQDPLTGLANRRHLEMSLASRVAELAGYDRRFGVLIADIDHFKVVNDRHGHATGDVALRTVARTLMESSRPTDDIARFGGEEFVLTIVDVDRDGLRAIADRFRAMVERSSIRTDHGDLHVTISIGGTLAAVGEAADTVFTRADTALYEAKRGGRNRVVVTDALAQGA
jgi:diguanylate cyclase (GGDEF)-like protein/PAS domain S-box-containing protein